MVETLIAFPVLVLVVMSLIQLGLLYKSKAVFNHATFKAARAGALDHAYLGTMRNSLIRSMAPLNYKVKPGDNPSILGYIASRERYLVQEKVWGGINGGYSIEIISPTEAMFDQFSKQTVVLESCKGKNCPSGGKFREAQKRIRQMPNDNLNVRDSSLVKIKGGQTVNIQDANLLKIETHACIELIVPIANRMLQQTMRLIGGLKQKHWKACELRGLIDPGDNPFIPITGHSVVRMQTPIRCEGDIYNGKNCKNLK